MIISNARRTPLAIKRHFGPSLETAEGFGVQLAAPLGPFVEEKLARLTKPAETIPGQPASLTQRGRQKHQPPENTLEKAPCTPSLAGLPAAPRRDVTMEEASLISTVAPLPWIIIKPENT